MDEQIEDLTPNQSPGGDEEPWCATCNAFTDYRRKWDSIQRSDLDGGSYSENIEVPHCIQCEQPMLLLSTCRKLVWFVNFLAIISFLIGLLSVFFLFGFSIVSMVWLSLHAGFCFLISLLPQKSKLTLLSHKKAKKEQSMKELLQKL